MVKLTLFKMQHIPAHGAVEVVRERDLEGFLVARDRAQPGYLVKRNSKDCKWNRVKSVPAIRTFIGMSS